MKFNLISYPRSGSNWLAYIIEQAAWVPVLDGGASASCCSSTREDIQNVYVEKTHGQYSAFWRNKKLFDENYVLILRNYKECVTKHIGKYSYDAFISNVSSETALDRGIKNGWVDYMATLDLFDQSKGKKLLVYYEDLISNYANEIDKIVLFFLRHGGHELSSPFIRDYEDHVSKALSLHNKKKKRTTTDGSPDKLIFHSNKIPIDEQIKIDKYIETNFENLYNRYLKRYVSVQQN